MVRSVSLTESTSWYEADSHLLKQSHAVEHVWNLTALLHVIKVQHLHLTPHF